MKKRILSMFLAVAMLFGSLPYTALAAGISETTTATDSTVSETDEQAPTLIGEDSSIEMKLNEWYDVDMTKYFEDPEGSEMTYYVTYDGETWDSFTKTDFRFYPNGTGSQYAIFKAVDASGNESETFKISATVKKPANKVTVNFSVTQGEKAIYTANDTDKVMVPTSLTVPYFDLALYGLDRYYYNPQCYLTADGNIGSGTAGTKDTANGIVTVMHVFIYATEVLYLGYDTSDAGTGKSFETGEFQQAIMWNDQAAGSTYVALWDHGSNLNYYVDWQYPVGAPGWGSTSDQIALYGGEDISIHMIESTNATGSDFAFFTTDGELDAASQADTATVMQGKEIALTAVQTVPDYDAYTTNFTAYKNRPVYWCTEEELSGDMTDDSVWSNKGFGSDALTTDENGQIVLDTSDMEPGVYYIAAEGMDDRDDNTETGAALIKLTVESKPTDYDVTVTQNDEAVTVTNTGNMYNKAYVYFAELPEFGGFTFDDDSDVALRYITTGRQSMPFTATTGQNTSTKEAIEEKYGTIEGLDSENTLLQVYEVCQVSGYRGKGAPIYVLIVEVPIVRVSELTLDKTELELEGGAEVQLTATVAPENASYPTVTWTSSNTASVEVSSTGLIKTYDKGEAVITATADGMSASCTVTVTKDYPRPTTIFSGNWPYGNPGINKVAVNGVGVDNTYVVGSDYYVTMDADRCADDALFKLSLSYSAGSSSQLYLIINDGETEGPITAGGTRDIEVQLADGVATVQIGVSAYSAGRTNYKTFHFRTDGKFPVAPALAGGSSATALLAEGDTYSLELAPLFKNISDKDMTYTVSIDDADPVAADTAYEYICDTPGTHKLVFTANNTYGDSPVYTATLTVIPEEAIYRMNRETENGGIAWFAFTDGSGNFIEGTTVAFNEETKTFDITLPMDIELNSKVITYYMPMGTSFFTGSNATAGASQWSKYIRTQHTSTLSGGKAQVSTSIYFYDEKPTHADNAYETYYFNYARLLPEGYFEYEITDVPKNKGGWDYETKKIMINGDEGSVVTHQWNTNRILHVVLGEDVPDNGTVASIFSGTGSWSGHGAVTLEGGAGTQTVTNISTMGSFWGTCKWTVNYKKDNLPAFAEGVEGTVEATVPCLDTYALDLTTLFTDPDEADTLTYEVRVDGGDWTAVEDPAAYSFTPDFAKAYTLEFRAYDGFVYSEDVYTVNIKATNSTILYDVTVNNLPKGAEFYCNVGFEDGTAIDGEGILTKRDNETNSYLVQVPKNVTRINIVYNDATITAAVSPDNETNVIDLKKVTFELQTLAGDPATGSVAVTYGDGYKATGNGLEYYLVPGEGYTYTATPDDDYSGSWVAATLEEQTVAEDSTVVIQFGVKSAKSITIDDGAELNVYYQDGYYILRDVEPVVVTKNDDGTTTYTYSCPKGQAYSRGYMYFATKDNLIDKAGYLMDTSNTTITWADDERTGDYRAEYDPGVGQGERGDDSVMVNVNSQNHLILEEGETFRLRAFRIWEIINSDTENVMLEPQFTYTGYDEDIISMVSANEAFEAEGKNQLCGTGGNNWMDLTVKGKGVTFLEVGYEAIHLVDGYSTGAWGGAGAASDDFTWNAVDPARTALIVVQTDGKAAEDVYFNIDCFSSNVSGNYYIASQAVEWDAEFDTLYFLGDKGQITLAPEAAEGKIASVAVSSDKGETWTTLTAEKGVYTADIYSGNNIIRVTKDDGTTAYQVVRGDKITTDITLVKDVNEDGEVDPGDTVRVTYNGLHNPIGKMSGIYNPGFGQGQRITYTWEGSEIRQSEAYQYNFVSNAWIDVTIPEESVNGFTLTNGYINFNVFGDAPGNHRNLTDNGRQVNTSAASSKYTRCILPDITLYTPIYENGVDDTYWPNYNAYIDKIAVSGVSVETYEMQDDLIYVVLEEGTADDAQFSLFLNSNSEKDTLGLFSAKIDGTEAGTGKVALVDGKAVVNVTGSYLGSETKTIIFSSNYEKTVTEPTCTEKGYTTYIFDDGASIVTDYTDVIDHTYDEGKVTTEPTCVKEGVKTFTCSCGATKTESIPATGNHVYDEGKVTTEPTCTEAGVKTYTCECGAAKTEEVAATGHQMEDGVCTVCGYVDPDKVTFGDLNGDGEIDIVDANLIAGYYNEVIELTDEQLAAADVNGDGIVDILDANLVSSYYNEVIDSFPVKK